MSMIDNVARKIGGPIVNHPDRLSGIVLLMVALFAWFESRLLPFGSINAPDAGFFPQSLSALLFLFSGAILVHSFSREMEPADFTRRSWLVPAAGVTLVAYAVLLPYIGFVIATVIVMVLIMRGLVKKSWLSTLTISLATVLISYLAFVKLGVPLPRGPLPF
jgi:putative tricarboxylic transport membrane protein